MIIQARKYLEGKKNVCMFMHFFFGLHIPFLSEEEEWQFRLEKNGP